MLPTYPHAHVSPFITGMATIALRTEVTVMYIVPIMAGSAGFGRLDLSFHRALMALVAVRNFVRSGQLEVGLVVIEIPGLPATHVVAFLALRTQAPLVHLLVVFCMA